MGRATKFWWASAVSFAAISFVGCGRPPLTEDAAGKAEPIVDVFRGRLFFFPEGPAGRVNVHELEGGIYRLARVRTVFFYAPSGARILIDTGDQSQLADWANATPAESGARTERVVLPKTLENREGRTRSCASVVLTQTLARDVPPRIVWQDEAIAASPLSVPHALEATAASAPVQVVAIAGERMRLTANPTDAAATLWVELTRPDRQMLLELSYLK